jgi:hypothetical protein
MFAGKPEAREHLEDVDVEGVDNTKMNLKEVVDGNELSNFLRGEEFLGYRFLKKTVLHGVSTVTNFIVYGSELILMSSGYC